MRRNLNWRVGVLALVATAAGMVVDVPAQAQTPTPFSLPDPASQPVASTLPVPMLPTFEDTPTLKTILQLGLRCRRQYEFDFTVAVVEKVENGELPLDLTLAIFSWARQKRPRYPFIYFQRAMQLRAEELGVEL
jgi:hypothetical protein